MLFLLCKYLKIGEGQYNSVGEVIDEFSDELEDCIKVIEIKDLLLRRKEVRINEY